MDDNIVIVCLKEYILVVTKKSDGFSYHASDIRSMLFPYLGMELFLYAETDRND